MEQFYNSRKRASRKKHNINMFEDSQSITQTSTQASTQTATVRIPTLACWLFLSHIFDKKKLQTIRKPGSNFNVMTIDRKNPLRRYISTLLEEYEISVARIYEFIPQQKNSAHIDHLFPDKDVIIIRLNKGDSRLKINSKLVTESVGKGYVFSSDTIYEVLEGQGVRYSLVLWGKKKQPELNN